MEEEAEKKTEKVKDSRRNLIGLVWGGGGGGGVESDGM